MLNPSLASCLSSHGESLSSVPIVYGLSFPKALPIAAFVSDVNGAVDSCALPDHGLSEAHNGPPGSILSISLKTLGSIGLFSINVYL
ncbi:hypothetical protein Tco_0345521 [Tanacetum coccineum]